MKIKFYGALLLFSIVFSFIYTESGICITNSFDYPLVFVSRNHRDGGNINFPSAGLLPGMGPHSRFAKVGGRLLRLDANGTIVTLVDSLMNFNGIKIYDVQQPCVHWTGQKLFLQEWNIQIVVGEFMRLEPMEQVLRRLLLQIERSTFPNLVPQHISLRNMMT